MAPSFRISLLIRRGIKVILLHAGQRPQSRLPPISPRENQTRSHSSPQRGVTAGPPSRHIPRHRNRRSTSKSIRKIRLTNNLMKTHAAEERSVSGKVRSAKLYRFLSCQPSPAFSSHARQSITASRIWCSNRGLVSSPSQSNVFYWEARHPSRRPSNLNKNIFPLSSLSGKAFHSRHSPLF